MKNIQATMGIKPYEPNLVRIFKLFKLNKMAVGINKIIVIYWKENLVKSIFLISGW